MTTFYAARARSMLPQMLSEILRRAAPGLLGALPIVHRHALLVGEAVLGVVAMDVERLVRRLHRLLERIDRGRRAPVVLAGEMRLQRDAHVRGLCGLLRRNAVE